MDFNALMVKLQAKLDETDRTKRSLFAILQFNIRTNGKVEKTIVIDLHELKSFEGKSDKADVEVTIDDADFFRVFQKEITFADLLSSGKATSKGNNEILNALQEKMK